MTQTESALIHASRVLTEGSKIHSAVLMKKAWDFTNAAQNHMPGLDKLRDAFMEEFMAFRARAGLR